MAATTLGQIVGVEAAVRPDTENFAKAAFGALATEAAQQGLEKTHEALEGRMPQPAEIKRVQLNTTEILREIQAKLTRMFDVTATRDWANAGTGSARADVTVDGNIILHDAPATYLLWLDKQLNALQSGLAKLPVQSPGEDWETSSVPGIWRTPQVVTPSTTKDKDWKVVVQPTDHFPAEVRETSTDVQTGSWTTVKYTSSVPMRDKMAMIDRVRKLREAVQMAVHVANRAEVRDQHVGETLLGYVFSGANGHK